MNIETNTIRLLGAAVLFVFIASVLSEGLLTSIVGTGDISDILVNISSKIPLMRISNLIALANSLGIVVLAVLLYVVFNKEHPIIALVALGWWLVEAVALVVSKIGTNALIPLSQEFIAAGVPASSHFQTLATFFYDGVDRQGYLIHNLFFGLGGILWYFLFLRSGYIPQILALWGLAGVSLLLIAVVLALYDRSFTCLMVMAIPYAPYELFLGVWLIVKGFN